MANGSISNLVLQVATKIVTTKAWITKLSGWGSGYTDFITNMMLSGLLSGWGPKKTATELRKVVENMPTYAARNLTRTLQLTSYREASLAMEEINGGFIEYKIRIAELDADTCLSCVALHGTRLEKGERVDDHFNGRCTEFYVVEGGPRSPSFMQSDSRPGDRNFVPFQTGEEWLASMTPDRLAEQSSFAKSPGKLEAYQNGTPIADFVGEYDDPVFGNMVVEKPLRDVVE